ncbi:hypothetical protein L6R49_00220 [Myxococcota bacterium]|nr:hypothetical protein [Myxococcota bacterium]
MSRRSLALLALLVACADPPSGDSAPDSAPDSPADSAPDSPADSAPDSAPPCEAGLTASIDGASAAALSFGEAPARGDALTLTVTLQNGCDERLRLLGHPDEWVTGAGFSLESLPPVLLEAQASATISLRFEPGDEGLAEGAFSLPYDHPGSPLALPLSATVGPPLTLVLVGDGRHVLTTHDYGETAALDSYETLTAHGDALQRGVCAGGGRFVAVGGNSDRRWWTSEDGVTWAASSSSGSPIGACAYGDGLFVGFDGLPLRSTDGLTWTGGGYSPGEHLRAMTFGGGAFVAVGDAGRVAITEDGVNWLVDQTICEEALGVVVYGDGVLVAAGASGRVARSDDGGITWSLDTVGDGTWRGLVYGDGAFFLGDGATLYRSEDGERWEYVNAVDSTPVAALGGLLFGISGQTLTRSEDGGLSWSPMITSAGGLGLSRAALGGPL